MFDPSTGNVDPRMNAQQPTQQPALHPVQQPIPQFAQRPRQVLTEPINNIVEEFHQTYKSPVIGGYAYSHTAYRSSVIQPTDQLNITIPGQSGAQQVTVQNHVRVVAARPPNNLPRILEDFPFETSTSVDLMKEFTSPLVDICVRGTNYENRTKEMIKAELQKDNDDLAKLQVEPKENFQCVRTDSHPTHPKGSNIRCYKKEENNIHSSRTRHTKEYLLRKLPEVLKQVCLINRGLRAENEHLKSLLDEERESRRLLDDRPEIPHIRQPSNVPMPLPATVHQQSLPTPQAPNLQAPSMTSHIHGSSKESIQRFQQPQQAMAYSQSIPPLAMPSAVSASQNMLPPAQTQRVIPVRRRHAQPIGRAISRTVHPYAARQNIVHGTRNISLEPTPAQMANAYPSRIISMGSNRQHVYPPVQHQVPAVSIHNYVTSPPQVLSTNWSHAQASNATPFDQPPLANQSVQHGPVSNMATMHDGIRPSNEDYGNIIDRLDEWTDDFGRIASSRAWMDSSDILASTSMDTHGMDSTFDDDKYQPQGWVHEETFEESESDEHH